MSGQRNNYGKRYHSEADYPDSGGNKRRNYGDERDLSSSGQDDTVYRYLCSVKKIGSIIGRGGEIVKQLRSDTQAKIRIGDTVPGCDERVITIYSSSRKTNRFYDTGDDICPAQDALFKVHESLLTVDSLNDEDADADAPQVTVRLLVPSDQIGCIIGKGGQIVQGIRSDTGAQIRILKSEHLPPCALNNDELLQIYGEAPVVKKALFQVSSRLYDNPSRSQHLLIGNFPVSYAPIGSHGVPNTIAPVMSMGPPFGGYKGDAGDWSFYPGLRDESSAKEFGFRLLCPSVNIGAVIGKSGVIIKQIRQESGATIKVDSSSSEDDCVIAISAKEFFDEPISPTLEAALRLQPRCSEKIERESGEPSYTTRLLVPTSRIGCLIGKGGSIISDMRRATRANIRILPKENLPKVASEDDEMVQISGDLELVKSALVQIIKRLKAHFFEKDAALSSFPSFAPYHSISSDISDVSKYGGWDGKSHGRGGYSPYSGGYGASVDLQSDRYGGYSGSQRGGGRSSHATYGGYSGRSGGNSGFFGVYSMFT
ncbi:K Homology domain-containing protein [Dioscorea alata]|uniref:K Homology domain-containing protein n=3 Tax=Dioscorea alata TaxID=55571 RepID=A0ACB7U7U5_DIOAL|nr:K Homology domain-containing protein [Dioscorea alata]KAH7656390.1 K Homology domain-containing protein [Dioscorea alata]KAH7656392.1 K Homology domain-containing protein [Dioscorea alata]